MPVYVLLGYRRNWVIQMDAKFDTSGVEQIDHDSIRQLGDCRCPATWPDVGGVTIISQ
jgi:hypothetical protein